MGRGRAKAKQQKVARELKYSTHNTDFSALQRELGGPNGSRFDVDTEQDSYSEPDSYIGSDSHRGSDPYAGHDDGDTFDDEESWATR
jgi:hypothetical protein